MPDDEKHMTDKPASKRNKNKKEKPKSFLETVREIDEKERQREEEIEAKRQKILEERKKKEQAAYDKKIQEERIELMRLKQGLITESETIHEEKDLSVKRLEIFSITVNGGLLYLFSLLEYADLWSLTTVLPFTLI